VLLVPIRSHKFTPCPLKGGSDSASERVELAGFAVVLEEHFVVLDRRMLAADCSWRGERDREAHVADGVLFWRCSRLAVNETMRSECYSLRPSTRTI
jgi:hypothetical protein